jgi:hypothetical protein
LTSTFRIKNYARGEKCDSRAWLISALLQCKLTKFCGSQCFAPHLPIKSQNQIKTAFTTPLIKFPVIVAVVKAELSETKT